VTGSHPSMSEPGGGETSNCATLSGDWPCGWLMFSAFFAGIRPPGDRVAWVADCTLAVRYINLGIPAFGWTRPGGKLGLRPRPRDFLRMAGQMNGDKKKTVPAA
jgi:hypothetical protein